MTDLHIPRHWRYRLLGVLDAPSDLSTPNDEDLRFLQAWFQSEGGAAQYNPLNTTFNLQGSWNYNDSGVKNYRTALDGICATALTLQLSYYYSIATALKDGSTTAENIVRTCRTAIVTWGTNPDTMLGVLKSI